MEQQVKEFGSLMELLEDLDREGITGYQRQMIMQRFLSKRAIITKTPYVGSFELTPLCNLDCKMCYVHLTKSQMDRDLLKTEQWIDIAHQAIAAGMMHAEITGGECLTYPGFKDFYLYLYSEGIKVSLLTNGVLLTTDMVEFLAAHRPDSVQVTLYGSCEEAYEKVTGHRVFQQTIDGIQRLRASGIKVKASITPNRYAEDDLISTVELLRSMNIEYAVSSATLTARPETGRKIEDYVVREATFISVQQNERDFYYQKLQNATIHRRPSIEYRPTGLMREGIPCGAGKNSFHVNWKGEICPCIAFSSLTFSIAELGFKTAWKKLNDVMCAYTEPEECLQCSHKDICMMCPADRTAGVYGGNLNKAACMRIQSLLDAGLISENNV